ncbi:putative glycosyltransferase EpsJ [Lachnospiraceae bacterium]|nr:putative glycosyltransferase EpsJ [Lachnospiraceae bacterium]
MKGETDRRLVSVIVAAYNIEEYLPRCLDSLLGQSYPHMEFIVVDDGSKDSTGAVCDRYAAMDKRIKVIHQANMGLSGARNSGLSLARGEYIGYVDGDDWVERDMYKAMLDACEDHQAQMAVCAYWQGAGADENCFTGKAEILTREEALEVYICDNRTYHIYNSVWSKLFRRDLVEGIRFPVGRKSEDIIYTTKAFLNIKTCVYLDTPFYHYTPDREGSIMNQGLGERRFQDEIPFWREQVSCLKEAQMGLLAKKAAYHFYRRMLFYYVDFREREMGGAARELAGLLRREREEIRRIYGNSFVAAGDKARMALALLWPGAYYQAVRLYDRLVIPLRQKKG